MSWLAGLFASIAYELFKRAGDDIFDYLKKKEALAAVLKKAQEDAKKSVAPLEKAQTAEEIDAASRDAFDGM